MRRAIQLVTGLIVLAAGGQGFAADPPPLKPDPLGRVETLPDKPGTHWVWVSDMVWFAMPDGRATLVDADTGTMLGMLSTGYTFNSLSLPREFGEIYSAETYYSRYTRGDREDVVTVYDARDLAPIAEIGIPPKRASTTPKLSTASLTDDDRFMAVWNYTPAQSLSIVDLEAREFVGEVPMPGCALAFPAGARRFLALCGNGTVQPIVLDDQGQATAQGMSEQFFDVDADPVTEKGVRRGDQWYFVSYAGVLHTVDISGDEVEFPPTWSLVTDADRQESWRIGGIQHLAVHRAGKRLYALMHQGPKDTHHQAGTEVWVYDLDAQKRIQRFELIGPAASIEVSQDAKPLLYAVYPDVPELVVYDALTGAHLRTVAEISITPSLIQLPTG
jgi:methylamine dehydrogenase heavy chain